MLIKCSNLSAMEIEITNRENYIYLDRSYIVCSRFVIKVAVAKNACN